jgi:hypothetical protein
MKKADIVVGETYAVWRGQDFSRSARKVEVLSLDKKILSGSRWSSSRKIVDPPEHYSGPGDGIHVRVLGEYAYQDLFIESEGVKEDLVTTRSFKKTWAEYEVERQRRTEARKRAEDKHVRDLQAAKSLRDALVATLADDYDLRLPPEGVYTRGDFRVSLSSYGGVSLEFTFTGEQLKALLDKAQPKDAS